MGDGLYFQLSTYPYYGPTRKVKLTKTHLPFGCLVCLGSASRPLVANQRRFNQVHPIDRTYKGSRPPKVSICFTCGFQMFNPVLYEIWNVNVTSLILSLMAPLQERVIRVGNVKGGSLPGSSRCVKLVPFHMKNLPKDRHFTHLQDPGITPPPNQSAPFFPVGHFVLHWCKFPP